MVEVRATGDPSELEKDVEADIRAFGKWFCGLDNDPLVNGEKAIIKTYLYWKLRAPNASPTRG